MKVALGPGTDFEELCALERAGKAEPATKLNVIGVVGGAAGASVVIALYDTEGRAKYRLFPAFAARELVEQIARVVDEVELRAAEKGGG